MLLKTVTLQSYTTLSTNGAHLPQSVYLPAHVWGSDGVPLLVGLHFLALLPQQAQLPITVMQPLGSGQRHMVTIHKLLSKNDQMIVIHAMLWQKYWELSQYIWEFDIMMNYYKRVEYQRFIGTSFSYYTDSVQLMYCIECTMGFIAWGAGWEAYIVEAKPSGAFALRPCPECTKSHDVHTHFLILYFAGQNIAHSVRCGNRHFYLTYIAQKLLTHDRMLLLVGEAKRPGGHYEVSTIIIPLPVGI